MYKIKVNKIYNTEVEVFAKQNADGSITSFGKYEDSTDYANYLLWLSEGNTPEPADIPPEPTYQELRASAYPPAADYLDAIVKGDTAQAQAYIDECLAVKAKYPK